jgi:hypothetical protein
MGEETVGPRSAKVCGLAVTFVRLIQANQCRLQRRVSSGHKPEHPFLATKNATKTERGAMPDQEVLANQKTILGHQASILENQKTILHNQAGILQNQKALEEILVNQKEILSNQKEILSNQKSILASVKK